MECDDLIIDGSFNAQVARDLEKNGGMCRVCAQVRKAAKESLSLAGEAVRQGNFLHGNPKMPKIRLSKAVKSRVEATCVSLLASAAVFPLDKSTARKAVHGPKAETIPQIYRKGGLPLLYRNGGMNLLLSTNRSAGGTLFAGALMPVLLPEDMPHREHLKGVVHGVATTVWAQPGVVLKTHLMVSDKTLMEIIRGLKPRDLASGMCSMGFRNTSYSVGQLGFYSLTVHESDSPIIRQAKLIVGSIVAVTMSHPANTVGQIKAIEGKNSSTTQIVRKLWRQAGVKGFYRGFAGVQTRMALFSFFVGPMMRRMMDES